MKKTLDKSEQKRYIVHWLAQANFYNDNWLAKTNNI